MRFYKTIASAALLAASVHAEDEASSSSSVSSEASSSTSTRIELPTFTPTKLKASFLDQFNDLAKWKVSHAKKDTKDSAKADEEWTYNGVWDVEEPTIFKGMEGDKGLVMKSVAAHHAISAKFDKKIDNKGKTLVVQYEVKLQDGLSCGGAYLKLLRDNKELHANEFSNASPYVIMFGPDKCGMTNKVHLIINHRSPKTKSYEEKHLTSPPAARIVKTTELYTLIIHPNNTGAIKLNDEQVREFNLLEDFQPAFNPPKEISDEKDVKPSNWVEEEKIADPEAKKPADWDEDQPFEVVDESAEKPADWREDLPVTIPDPESSMPSDWDEEEDGDWVAPTVPNPACDNISGCGPWTKPMKKNELYKGKWSAPLIDNPAYKGVWAPRLIPNPNYFEEKHPANLEPMGAVGFELWTMDKDILFDNIYIGHSIEDAKKFAEETFHKKHPIEQLVELESKPKDEDEPAKSPSDLKFFDDPMHFIKEKLDLFFTIAQKDPLQAVKFVPEVAGGFAAILTTFILIIVGIVSAGGSTPPAVKKTAADAKATAANAKDKVAEAVASGADKAKAEVNKRTTRGSS